MRVQGSRPKLDSTAGTSSSDPDTDQAQQGLHQTTERVTINIPKVTVQELGQAQKEDVSLQMLGKEGQDNRIHQM